MSTQAGISSKNQLRYDVYETPPFGLSTLLAVQIVLLIVPGIVLTPAIVLRGAGMPESMESSVIFYALLVSGVTTILQARRVWRLGAGYILLMGTSGAFIAVGITALEYGGMGLLMTLIVVSSLIQFVFANNLGLLRRVVTPLVGGTTIMLLAVTVMPIAFKHFPAAGQGDHTYEAPLVAFVTLASILLLSFFGNRNLRLWAPLIGIVLGSILSYFFGDLNLDRVSAAEWVGVAEIRWSSFDLSFKQYFWVLLPAFLIVTIVGAIETYGDAIAIQHISNRTEKPIDFRAVQGALYADGLGNFLSGCLGTMPNTTYSTSISVVDMTGVAARKVGVLCGAVMLLLAFLPKLSAAILSIPKPVVGSYLLVLILLLFMHGVRMVASDGLSYEKGFIVGMGFWLGTGFQQKAIFYNSIPGWLKPILDNGMTSGTLITLLLVGLLSIRRGKKASIKTEFSLDSLSEIQKFIEGFVKINKWDQRIINRIHLAAEETLLGLVEVHSEKVMKKPTTFRMELRVVDNMLEMDIAIAAIDNNIEALISVAKLSNQIPMNQLPFKILSNLADDIRHYQFHGLDFICLKIRCF